MPRYLQKGERGFGEYSNSRIFLPIRFRQCECCAWGKVVGLIGQSASQLETNLLYLHIGGFFDDITLQTHFS